MKHTFRTSLFVLISLMIHQFTLGQGINTKFGQNRVQHQEFIWSYLRSENFDGYFYSGGREIANYAVRYAEQNLDGLEKTLDHRLSGRIEIICYNSQGDFKQSNFGLEDLAQNTGGYTSVINNKVYVYFNGSHADLVRQLRDGIALVLLNELLYGGSFTDRVSSAASLNLPQWYLRGLTSYLSRPWDVEMDNRMKDAIHVKKLKRFNRLSQKDPVFAGHSMWKFLIEKYGDEVIANMVYITKLTRNYENAFQYVTSLPFKDIQNDWLTYYTELYSKEDNMRTLPSGELKIKRRVAQYLEPQMRVSPKGNYLAFTSNKNGKFKVWLMDTKTGKTKKIFKGGLKYNQLEIDHSFPLLAWQAGGDKLGYVYEKRGDVYLRIVDLVNKKKETIRFLKFEKITGIDFSDNGRTIVVSAIRKGQSDIYTYDIPTRKEKQVTYDFWDDQYPRFVDFGTKIVFSSNRQRDSIGVGNKTELAPDNNYDIFQYDLETGSNKLKRYTNTPYINEILPFEYNKDFISYLTEYNGIQNRYAARIEEEYDYTELHINYSDSSGKNTDTLTYQNTPPWSGKSFSVGDKQILLDQHVKGIDTIIHMKDVVYTFPQTNYTRNILAVDVARQTQQIYELFLENNKYSIRPGYLSRTIEEDSKKIETYPNMFRLKTGFANKPFVPGRQVLEPFKEAQTNGNVAGELRIPVDTTAYFFVNEFTPQDFKRPSFKIITKETQEKEIKKQVKVAAPSFYNTTFFADKVVTQIDNSMINTYYQPLTPGGSLLFNPGLNGMFKFGMIDLFEDYRFTGGLRASFDLHGFDYFASFETLKKKWDHKFTFYRQSRREGSTDGLAFKNFSHEMRYILTIPFNQVSSIRFNAFYRQDRSTILSTNPNTLETPDIVNNWAGGKLEYVYDNTIPKGLNLWNGTRFKIFYEHYYNLGANGVQLDAMGFDFRHYEKVHRQLIWATRFSANTSIGTGKVVYYLGGVENWLSPRFNNSFSISPDQNYVFQALACNLRGFDQNIRNGNSFAVINTEIRFPVFQYAFNKVMRSEFLNNFQIIPFFDIGSAWVGSNPYSDENTFNQKIYEQGPIKAKVINVHDPIVAGYGAGLRSKLMGYFLRFDVAYGIQDMQVTKKPVSYFSIGTDF